MKKNRIGIFGGTFDPVHNGHLIIAEYILEHANLERIIFVPSAQPPHKNYQLMFSPLQRLKMIEAAIEGNPCFTVSDVELKRAGFSYTIDTIKQIKEILQPDNELFFIIGKDTFYEIRTWKDPEAIIENCRLIVAERVSPEKQDVPDWIAEKADFIKTPIIEISSTEIKKRISEGKNIRYLVPGKVEEMINKERETRGLDFCRGEDNNRCRH